MTIDLQAVLRGLLKGMTVRAMHADEDSALFELVDADGKVHVLELRDRVAAPELERGEPDQPVDPVIEAARETIAVAKEMAEPRTVTIPTPGTSQATYEQRRQAARQTAHEVRDDVEAAFVVIRKSSDYLSNEAKGILAELRAAELKLGDDKLLLEAAAAAARGDMSMLKGLAASRRRPSATAPPS